MSEPSSEPGAINGPVAKICDGLAIICRAIAGLALLCIITINGANVVARYFFGKPFSWAEELMLFLMILAVFSGAIVVTWRNIHIRIDTFVERASPGFQRVTRLVATIISIVALLTVM